MRKIWIHYGNDCFNPEKVKENAKKLFSNKPNGLWASPVGRNFWSWKRWCESEDYHTERLEKYFKFRVSSKANLLWIHKLSDAEKYMIAEPYYPGSKYCSYKLNVEEVMNKFDGMVLIHGNHYCELHDNGFYTWDVDSICVWNPDMIELIK